jgi:hypothetical protein
MSTTATRVSSHINAYARDCVTVSERLIELYARVGNAHDALEKDFAERLDLLLRGPRVWLLMRQLKAMVIEIYDGNVLALKYVFPIVYRKPSSHAKEIFSDEIKAIEKEAKERGIKGTSCRLICDMGGDEWQSVPGWSPCQFADDSHLTRRELVDTAIETSSIRVEAYVYLKEDGHERSVSSKR